MIEDLNDDTTDTTDQDNDSGAAPAPAAKTITLPSAQLGRIRKEERARGAQAALEQQAIEAGFNSWDEMAAAAKASRRTTANPLRSPTQTTAPARRAASTQTADEELDEESSTPPPRRVLTRREALAVQQENERLSAEYKRQNSLRAKAVQENRRLARELEAARLEGQLRAQAIRAGIAEDSVDFALDRLRLALKGKSAAEAEKFNTQAFFATDLRKRIPALYHVEEQPLTTADAEDDGATAAPRTTTTQQKPPITPGRDARTMTRSQMDDRLKTLGLEG